MEISFQNREDGTTVFRVTRDDGTVTWQKQHGPNAVFFPFHDLCHYAVETVLGMRSAFYGLIAAGWDIIETDGKHGRGPLPAEAITVEHIVGLLDRERSGGGEPLSADEFNSHLTMSLESGRIIEPRLLTDAELVTIRKRIDELHGEWGNRAARHETLTLQFDA
jgi:hypothetical protein